MTIKASENPCCLTTGVPQSTVAQMEQKTVWHIVNSIWRAYSCSQLHFQMY